MNSEERRSFIRRELSAAAGPVSASTLAARLGVSRQVIVGDVALLRAAGEDILATPRGYVFSTPDRGLRRTVACVHTAEDTGKELNIMVDNGCTVLDVVIEHPVYGQMTGELHISCRRDVAQFVDRISTQGGAPLSALTGGLHLHTLICPSEEAFEQTCAALREAGMLLNND